MTVYPNAIDSDQTIVRVDDNLTEIGQEAINQLRDAVFAIESELGTNPAGSAGSVANRINTALNADGSIKESALSVVGLVTLPIANAHVGNNAGIKEFKLDLDYSTSNLHTLILANTALLTSLTTFTNTIFADLNLHIAGAVNLSDGNPARHVLSQIDVNSVPSDNRDLGYVWTGLKDKNGILRSATHAADALLQINNDLTSHENAVSGAHVATAVSVDVSNFQEIPTSANTAQKVFDYFDDAEVLSLGEHRATQHANAIPRIARAKNDENNDGYRDNVVPNTSALAYLVHPPNTTPVDDLSVGDDIIKFSPTNSNFTFDAAFSQVKIGDIISINYGNGLSAAYPIESIRYVPGTEWLVRINGVNLCESVDGYASARIDHALYDVNTYGVLAVAAVNATDGYADPIYTSLLSSVIVGHPRGANALGLGFDPGQINSSHYKLYLELYPTGNPTEHKITLPAIDVTGNQGATPGQYTLDSIVQSTNDSLRRIGFNYRFIAYQYNGEFGIMLADAINNASFAIINGDNTSGTLATGIFIDNVIGGNSLDSFDALGFGTTGSNIASPTYQTTWSDATAAQIPTKVIVPLKKRNYIANGIRSDTFAPTYLANTDGSWDGYISARTPIGSSTVEVTYTILLDLSPAKLKPGKTLVIQPTVDFDNSSYFDIDYGRFIIKSVNFTEPCGSVNAKTEITVINGIHATGNGFGFSSEPTLAVKIYFSEDSVDFDHQNLIDTGVSSNDYSRHHEIFITQEGKTFSHERMRMLRQTTTATLLGTTNWHIVEVSPKLRGYTGSNPLIFNKYLRFVITEYNSVSGEYDGYIGQIGTGSEVLKGGPTSTGRKNIPTRFYDETGVDYVDLVFFDDDVSPGTDIIPDAADRYVDLEIFSSLRTDDQLLFLATCEVNWDPVAGKNIIQYVRDTRQFGSVDELDFTNSAVDFISAADKHLHQNGVIRGLNLDFISTVPNSGEIYFKGGVALVDGHIVMVNNQSVTIPQIYQFGTSLPQNLDWIICLNSSGNLIPFILTSTKQQFFATANGSNSYYVPSLTFLEIINSRKDLTPIAITTVTIASLTVSSVSDCRKIIATQDYHLPLVWTSDDGYIGNFYSVSALKEWINNSNGYKNVVKVYGNFVMSNSTAQFDLTGFTQEVIFDGAEAVFDVAAKYAFWVGSNVTLKNFTFNYSHVNAGYTSDGLLNFNEIMANRANACIYVLGGTDIENITIDNCTFNYHDTSQRPPFIMFHMQKNQVDKNIRVINNKFNDINPVSLIGSCQAALAFWTDNSGVSSEPALLINAEISGNICSHLQGIYLTTKESGGVAASPGLSCINVKVLNNSCGTIGVVTSSVPSTNTDSTNIDKSTGIIIANNTCNFIGSVYGEGQVLLDAGELGYAIGRVSINNNFTNWISVQTKQISASNQYSSLEITSNKLTGYDGRFRLLFSPNISNYAINVFEVSSTDSSDCIISNNYIDTGRYDATTYTYTRGIHCSCSATIIDNIIRGLESGGVAYGIRVSNDSGGTAFKRYVVRGNKIYRGSSTIANYIFVPAAVGSTNGLVTENVFDARTVDGSNATVINNIPPGWIILRNKNQTCIATLSPTSGSWTVNREVIPSTPLLLAGPTPAGLSMVQLTKTAGEPNFDQVNLQYNDLTNKTVFHWFLPLLDILPDDVIVTKFEVDYSADLIPSVSSTLKLFISAESGSENSSSVAWNTGSNTLTLTPLTIQVLRYGNNASEFIPMLRLYADSVGVAIANLTISDIKITFIY